VDKEKAIFRAGSTTYYFSSIFFPKSIKADVFKLYSFVRVADDFVDNIPARSSEFRALRKLWEISITNRQFDTEVTEFDDVSTRVVKNMVYVARKYHFEQKWVSTFLDSMQADLDLKKYKKIDDTIWYMNGSAEVIGLMMAKIMNVPSKAFKYAQLQGRAMQYINFVRDISEDNDLGRQYFPASELNKFGLIDLTQKTATSHPEHFKKFMNAQILQYEQWQQEADKGFLYIPKRLRIPLQTATDMYNWTARVITDDPFIVYKKKVKPSKWQVFLTILKNTFK
jgi:phytoene synthase